MFWIPICFQYWIPMQIQANPGDGMVTNCIPQEIFLYGMGLSCIYNQSWQMPNILGWCCNPFDQLQRAQKSFICTLILRYRLRIGIRAVVAPDSYCFAKAR